MQTRTVSNPSDRRIERLDPALDRLVAPDAPIEVIAEGYSWSEGPIWVKDGGYPPVLGREGEHRLQVEAGRRREAVPEAVRLYWDAASRRRDGLERADARRVRSSRALSARRPPRRADGCAGRKPEADVHYARRPLSGQAVQQPERSRLQEQRRSLFHRSRVRHGEGVRGSGRELSFAGVYRRTPSGEVTLLTTRHDASQRPRVLARREAALRRAIGRDRRDLARLRRAARRHASQTAASSSTSRR